MAPLVTVIIPTYNWSTVLPYSVGSVLAQTFTDFELLVVGDGCSDDSERVVTAIDDPRVRWINLARTTGHQSGPNNEGLRQARGALIAYLGHDDLWLPHHLAVHVAAYERDVDLTSSIVALVGPGGRFVRPHVPRPERGRWMPPTAVVHRRALTAELGGWRDFRDLHIDPERDLWRRALEAGYQFAVVPRLTGVKFPASLRRGVYRDRPCDEQAGWFQRITNEPDIEATELAKMLVALNTRNLHEVADRAWRLMTEPSQWLAFVRRTHGARITARQRFKGLDRAR